tara:strand:+ start:27385 stop:28758 length:1374 start_codon:yes stop_codon:yes gene_type:complete
MKKKIIFITIESVKRELNSKILLALKALKRNYRVVIGQKGGLRQLIYDTHPGIMILKSFGPKNTKHINYIKKNNFKIVSSDEELITAMDFEDKIEWRMNNVNVDKIDLLLAVGSNDFPILKRKFGSVVSKILLCGNIRLELLKKKYSRLLEKDSQLCKKKYGNYILLLTSFGSINKLHEKYSIDFIFNRIIDEDIDPDSHHIYLKNEEVKMNREMLINTLKFIDNFEKNFPNKKLVISPHPNEKIEFWEHYMDKRKFKNIFINTDMLSSSYSIIYGSEMIISFNSTSLLEAHFLDKKRINLLGNKPRNSEIDLFRKCSKVVRSSQELIEVIKDLDKTEHQEVQEITEIKNYPDNFDSFDSILNSFDELEEVYAYDYIYKNNYYYLKSKLRSFKNYIKKIISYQLKLDPMIKHLHKKKVGDRMSQKNFIQNVQHINSLEKVDNLKIKKVAPEVFLLDT